ncbi:dynein regulatory complex protein 11-like [Protopterus annectens]|uniref:dynein regulatory complex protein 11-like n=1 Tax=Protopterus annectens TaxID=7888 RepID=UPI001CFA4842|nr:dynein regulatory complex protein 11-like [Protopterus annectens]
MSHSAYNKIWAEAQEAIDVLLQHEIPEQTPKPEKDRLLVFQMLANFYIKYIQIFQNLEVAYSQIVHPQKRRVIRHVLDGVMGRILELKNEMVELEFSEFHFFDDVLQDLKLTPEETEIPIPKYFITEKLKVLKDREKILAQILTSSEAPQTEVKKTVKPLSIEEAIKIIQIAERARQGHLRARFMKEIRLEELREQRAKERATITLDSVLAAIRIQKLWRGYVQRKKTKKEREEEMVFLGMAPLTQVHSPRPSQLQKLKVDALRQAVQEEHEAEFQQALVSIKTNVRDLEGQDIKDTLQDQVRQWFIEFFA